MSGIRASGLLALSAAALVGCGGAEERTLTVLAASSLTEAFTDLEAAFEAQNPGTDVILSFAGSQALATQIRYGVEADVFASADAHHAESLAAEGLLEPPRPFAQNALALATPAGSEALTLEALASVERLVVGADEAPIGRYTAALLDAAGARYGAAWRSAVEARIVSREPNARLVAAKVALGEADAAIVYATDGATGARTAPLPAALSPRVRCFHAALVEAPEPALARAWIALTESPEGQAALAARGFPGVAEGAADADDSGPVDGGPVDGGLVDGAPAGAGR